MHRLILIPGVVLFLCLLTVGGGGCGGNDGPAEPAGSGCSVTIETPAPGAAFLTGDPCNIRWQFTGSATGVRIELLEGGAWVGDITTRTENDGYFYWDAGVMDGSGGSDMAVRVTALGEDGCGETCGPLTIIDTSGCGIDVEVGSTTFQAGDVMGLAWAGAHTSGSVGIALWHGHEPPVLVGEIVAETPDDGSYAWAVDSFNDQAHRDVENLDLYWIEVADLGVEGCAGASADFTLIDDSVCDIEVLMLPPSFYYEAGHEVPILFMSEGNVYPEKVDIRLFAGGEMVEGGRVADGMDMVDGRFTWTVDDYGHDNSGIVYRIWVFDSEDDYCWGKSRPFGILE